MQAFRSNRSSSRANAFSVSRMVFEDLESRQMMSATAVPDALHAAHRTPPALSAELNHRPATARSTVGKSRTAGPGAEPRVDGNVTGWTNVSRLPLFSSAGPSPADIFQGQVGDCYFLSSLASTAYADPGLIRQDIAQRPDGTYDVFFWNGRSARWVDEHVNGYLPVNRSGYLEYAQLGQGNDTWVAIMEKAFAYFRHSSHGASYTFLNGGWPSEALRDLGATNLNDYNLSSMGGFDLATQVNNDLNAHRAVEISTANTNGPLVTLHAYSVLSVYQNSSGLTYLLVRNPWGTDGPNQNGYQYVSTDALLPELSDVISASI